jgi:hypothetical protein
LSSVVSSTRELWRRNAELEEGGDYWTSQLLRGIFSQDGYWCQRGCMDDSNQLWWEASSENGSLDHECLHTNIQIHGTPAKRPSLLNCREFCGISGTLPKLSSCDCDTGSWRPWENMHESTRGPILTFRPAWDYLSYTQRTMYPKHSQENVYLSSYWYPEDNHCRLGASWSPEWEQNFSVA